MNWNYSIVQISPNPELGDAVSIGIILVNKSETIIEYDIDKVKSLKKLFDFDIKIILRILKNFKDHYPKSTNYNHELKLNHNNSPIENLEYFDVYMNGLLSITKPQLINLAKESIGEFIRTVLKIKPKEAKVCIHNYRPVLEQNLYMPLKDKVHTNIEISNHVVPNLFFNIHFDALGLNGSIISAKFLNFNATAETIVKHLTNVNTALNILSNNTKNDNKGTMYIIAEEPKEKEGIQIWDIINKKESDYSVVHPDEVIRITNAFHTNGSKKFLEVS